MENQTIIVKKIKKGGHGHHGGAWKVAFADFAVAMMAFFLLLWLIASATPKQKQEMSEYFIDPVQHAKAKKATDSMIDAGGTKSTEKAKAGQDFKTDSNMAKEGESAEANQEKERLLDLMKEIRENIEASPELQKYKEQLKIDLTSEGLRIQILDTANRPMFDSGSAELKHYTKIILKKLAITINKVPNRISLSGHTDATRFVGRDDYSNWELSADRANASRRELIDGGMHGQKVAKVVGMSSMVLFDKKNPHSASNRRISIVVLNKEAEKALMAKGQHVPSEGDVQETVSEESPQELTPKEEPPVPVKPVPVEKPEPVVQPELVVKPKPVAKPKSVPKPKHKLKPKAKPKPAPKRAADKAAPPPVGKDEKQFINVPSSIAPISPIKLPSTP